jgi:hypothetical protein
MPIIGILPNNIQNGQTVDATPVMADFNFIVNQVNANGNPTGTLTAPSGTAVLFQQSVAPVGWIAQTATNDAAIRVMTPAFFVGVAGASNFSSLMRGGASTDGHSLTTGELAAHGHGITDPGHAHSVNDPGHLHSPLNPGTSVAFLTVGNGSGTLTGGGTSGSELTTNTVATGLTLNNNTTGVSAQLSGSGTAHTHNMTNFNYLTMDVISAVKA